MCEQLSPIYKRVPGGLRWVGRTTDFILWRLHERRCGARGSIGRGATVCGIGIFFDSLHSLNVPPMLSLPVETTEFAVHLREI